MPFTVGFAHTTLSILLLNSSLIFWVKILYTLFVLMLIPIYWKQWGPKNFLWFSDIALFVSVLALWLESSLLASMMAVGVLLPELYWNLELLVRLVSGKKIAGLTDYMWNTEHPLYLRLLSLFHVALPATLILMLVWWGYDSRALYYQTAFAWLILVVCYNFTKPDKNINWVFGFGNSPQDKMNPKAFLLVVMLAYLVLVFLPTHFLLKWIVD